MRCINRIIWFFLAILIITACNKKNKVVDETYSDGSPKVEKYYTGEGTIRELVKEVRYYSNKQIEMEGEYKDNKRNGDWVYYYKDGKVWSEGSFVNGLDEGKRTVYYENGEKRYEGYYTKGKKTGNWKFWEENGDLVKEIDFDSADTITSK